MSEQKDKPNNSPKKRIIGSSVKPCVHDLGIRNFIKAMKSVDSSCFGFDLGVADIDKIIAVLQETKRPGLIMGISFRLGVTGLKKTIEEFIEKIYKAKLDPNRSGIRYAFGGTVPGANLIRAMTGQPIRKDPFAKQEQKYDLEKVIQECKGNSKFKNFFELIADTKTKSEEIVEFAQPSKVKARKETEPAQNLVDRIKQVREKENRALRRVHIGIAGKLKNTIRDIEKITKENVWDIISIAPDQWAQQYLWHFINQEKDPKKYPFAQGGCPIRSKQDLIDLKKVSQCGNHPLMRIYSGTDKLIEIGKIFDETINICFPAVPIFWYNQLDGRGPIAIKEGIAEHQKVIKFWGKRNKPVEINDPHQWQLRESSDEIYVIDHLLCALTAKQNGVKNYIMQMMFNLPPKISPKNDLAKMKAAYELIRLLEDKNFKIIKETRGGLSSFPDDLDEAAGHLSGGAMLQLHMNPDIIHIVSKSEAHHEAGANDIIESCKHIEGIEKMFKSGAPNIWKDREIQKRKLELKRNAVYTLLNIALIGEYQGEYKEKTAIKNFDQFLTDEKECSKVLKSLFNSKNYRNKKCNLVNSDVLDLCLRTGLLQAPVLADIDKRYTMVTKCETEVINGACKTVEFNGEKVDNEIQRVKKAMQYLEEQIMGKKVRHKGEKLGRGISKEKVFKARNAIGIPKFHNKKVLVADFGSTFTKLASFNTNNLRDIKFNYVPTIVDNLEKCLAHGLSTMNKRIKIDNLRGEELTSALAEQLSKYDLKLASSSAKGGLKTVTVAASSESHKPAELAAFKAGGKILASYTGKLTKEQAQKIYQKDKPELILLTGGVNRGGNTDIVEHNARQIAEYAKLAEYAKYGVPVVYAGTTDAHRQVAHIFAEKNIYVKWANNVMPEINEFDIDTVEGAVNKLFREIIVKGKGFDKVQQHFDLGLLPTPVAALWGINLLACGYGEKHLGLKDIFAIDIGGCTTDVFRVLFRKNPLYEGKDNRRTRDLEPNLPPVTRRVEGKFGLSFNAINLTDVNRWKEGKSSKFINEQFQKIHSRYAGKDNSVLAKFFNPKRKQPIDVAEYLKYLSSNPGFIPKTKQESTVSALIANEILKACSKNNCGTIEPTETYYLQKGINFLNMPCTVLLIGGTVYHKCKENSADSIRDLEIIAKGVLFNEEEPDILRPDYRNATILADKNYFISIIGGLYGKLDPKRALKIMKNNLKKIEIK